MAVACTIVGARLADLQIAASSEEAAVFARLWKKFLGTVPEMRLELLRTFEGRIHISSLVNVAIRAVKKLLPFENETRLGALHFLVPALVAATFVSNDRNGDDMSPLLGAIEWDVPAAAVVLASMYPEQANTTRRSDNATPLILAAQNDFVSVVEALVRIQGTDVNAVAKNGATALFLAAQKDHRSVADCLLGRPEIDPNLSAPLIVAVQNRNRVIVDKLLQHPNINPNVLRGLDPRSTEKTVSALHIACLKGFPEIVWLLLEHPGIDPNIGAGGPIGTPLHMAVTAPSPAALRAMLGNPRSDVNAIDRHGRTALMLACSTGNQSAINELLSHPSVDVNKCLPGGETAWDMTSGRADLQALIWARGGRSGAAS